MNKLLVVTGGTKGIGRAILEKFMAQGFDVVTCARNATDLANLQAFARERYPAVSVIAHQADMASDTDVKRFAAAVTALDRPVDVLVNNAGYFVPGELCTEPDGTLDSMMKANLFSAYNLTRGIVPVMRAALKGHIFTICSIASIQAYANGGSYAVTKFALLGFTKCLREELKKDGIRVTAILPGATRTASWDGVDLPDERFMKVDDVADMVYAAYSISGNSVVEEMLIRPQLGDI